MHSDPTRVSAPTYPGAFRLLTSRAFAPPLPVSASPLPGGTLAARVDSPREAGGLFVVCKGLNDTTPRPRGFGSQVTVSNRSSSPTSTGRRTRLSTPNTGEGGTTYTCPARSRPEMPAAAAANE